MLLKGCDGHHEVLVSLGSQKLVVISFLCDGSLGLTRLKVAQEKGRFKGVQGNEPSTDHPPVDRLEGRREVKKAMGS